MTRVQRSSNIVFFLMKNKNKKFNKNKNKKFLEKKNFFYEIFLVKNRENDVEIFIRKKFCIYEIFDYLLFLKLFYLPKTIHGFYILLPRINSR